MMLRCQPQLSWNMDPYNLLAMTEPSIAPAAWAGAGAGLGVLAAAGLALAARRSSRVAAPLRFLAVAAGAWALVCLTYNVAGLNTAFGTYLSESRLVTVVLAGLGAACYIISLVERRPAERPWHKSGTLVAGLALMGSAFVRAACQPPITLAVDAPLALVFAATVWRLRTELLVYLAVLGVAVTAVLWSRDWLAVGLGPEAPSWIVAAAAAVSVLMVLAAGLLGLVPRQDLPAGQAGPAAGQADLSLKWYRQGLLIVPLATSSLAAMAAGYLAVWYGASAWTVWALAGWWAVLLVAAIGLRQADLLGFSSVAAGLSAAAAFAAFGGERLGEYWGRYPSLLLAVALGVALLSAALRLVLVRPSVAGYPRALYLAGAAIAIGALAVEPFGTTAQFLGVDLLLTALVLVLAHVHRAPAWVNYLVGGLATGGTGALVHLVPGTPHVQWHHRFILVTAAAGVAWLVVALAVREVLRRTSSDRTARRQTLPFTILGMGTTLVLAGYLASLQWLTYEQFLVNGKSTTLPLLGPEWGLAGWIGVLAAWSLSMWLVRHTARTFLFYCFGITAVLYTGLFGHTDDLYGYLITAVAGYGSAHLLVFLFEAKFMALLSRAIALYREERRASTTIFTLAVFTCFIGAILAAFRLSTGTALVMLAIMSAVFLAWSFIWLRGVMLYPGVLMVTLTTLAIWHNAANPVVWDAGRLAINAAILTGSAYVWLGIGAGLHPVRGEVFQLAGPARACSVILAAAATCFVAAMSVSPVFGAPVWRASRTPWDWFLGLAALTLLTGYFAWARFAFGRRFYGLMSGLVALLVGLYVGIYVGIRL